MENEMQIVARHLTSAPVDLEAIFADLGIGYCEKTIRTGESGWIERTGEHFEVVVNASDPAARRRFTAAHELAHYLIHRDLMDHGARMMRHTLTIIPIRRSSRTMRFRLINSRRKLSCPRH